MTTDHLIISPHYPPTPGGLSDHAHLLTQELSRIAACAVLTSDGIVSHQTRRPQKVSWHDATQLVATIRSLRPRGVIWEYVPQMYGRGGVNFTLAKVMRDLRSNGVPQLVWAHEIAAPFSWLPQRAFYAACHRWQWRRICADADVVGISTEAWLRREQARHPLHAGKMLVIPSSSNIPVAAFPEKARALAARKFGIAADGRIALYFGTISAPKQFGWVLSAVAAARDAGLTVTLISVGQGSRLPAAGPWHLELGERDAGEISLLLQASDVVLLPYVDGVSERRGSFMAALSHGCAVATTVGESAGPTLRQSNAFAASAVGDEPGFRALVSSLLSDAETATRLAARAAPFYRAHYDWACVMDLLRRHLPVVSPAISPTPHHA